MFQLELLTRMHCKPWLILLFLNFYIGLQAQIQVSGLSTQTSITNSTPAAVAPGLTVTSSENITNFTVSIIDSYSASDALSYPSGSLPPGVTVVPWSQTTRSIVFKGTKTAAEWQAFLRTVTLSSGNVCSPENRKVSFVAEETFYNPLNGHFYRLTDTTSSWTNTENTASSTSYYGREGYLVTLTSAAENTFVSRLIGENSWMGASDDHNQINTAVGYPLYANTNAAEGKFYWVTGPEKGTQMTTANGNGNGLPGVYQNWKSGEPNDYQNGNPGESFGHVYTGAGDWNDFPNSSSIKGILEFGDMPNDVVQSEPKFTKDVFIQGSSSGSISGGEVTVCSGTNSTTLTLIGLTGSVVRWESSVNNFITTGVPISNSTTTHTVTNISQTMYYRAVVNSTSPSNCNGLVTSSEAVYVENANAGNVLANNTTICAGANVELYLSGQQGDVQKWQRSADNSNWTDIANTTTNFEESLAITGTYYYRAFVQVPGCGPAVASAAKKITVVLGAAPIGGMVSSETVTSTTNNGTLTLTGHTGTVTKWQRSTDQGIIWTDIANTGTTYTYTNIAAKTLFRALITNGSCGSTYSAKGLVTLLSPPTITGFAPILAGNGETVTITGNGFTGTIAIAFGATSATSFTVVSDTEITAVVGTGSSGSVTVTNPAGNDLKSGFTYKVAQYNFENSVLDETDNNHDGTEINSVTYQTGAQGQAICFDNGPGYVKLPDNLIRSLSEFTISLRFKTTATGSILGYQNVTALTSSPSEWIPILLITSDGKLKGTLWTGPGGAIQAISTNTVNDGNWHQVDLVGDANAVSIYLDGNLEASQSGASVVHLSMIYNQLGLSYTNNYNTPTNTTWEYFKGCIDDLVIIDRALTAQELEEVTALPEPSITSFTPSEAWEQDTVVITGTNFDGATQVTFGGDDALSYTVDSSTQITAISDKGASGDVTVTTAGGTAIQSGFTYYEAKFTVSETALTLKENGESDTFTVVLDTQPPSDVVFDISSSDTDEATISAAQLTFTNTNWNTPQSITVTGVDDTENEDGSAIITIAVNVAGSDDAFDSLANKTLAITLTNVDEEAPTMVLAGDTTLGTDTANCYYTVQGSELDPTTVTDNSGNVASLTYAIQKSMPNPTLVSEDFNSGNWNTGNFELGSNTGSVVNGSYKSDTGSRGTLRSVADFVPTVGNPLYVSATLAFTSGSGIAFIGTRSTGQQPGGNFNAEPEGLVVRIHNFNDGQTSTSSGYDYQPRPGNAFYNNPVRFQILDDGAAMNVTMTNLTTNVSYSFSYNSGYTSSSNRVVFSGDNTASWDDIQISLGAHESLQEYENGSNSVVGKTLETGEHTLVWTATDDSGNETTESQVVTVHDNVNPTVTTQDITVTLDKSGEASILPSEINTGSTDNCGIATITLDKKDFTAADTGDNTVTLTVTDVNGNINTDTALVTVIDTDTNNDGLYDGAFVTTWKTDNPGTSNTTSITIPTTGLGYNYDVDWDNDGVFDNFSVIGDITHDYGSAGTYTVTIRGDFPNVYFNNSGDKEKILTIEQWGAQQWTSMAHSYNGCANLTNNATDAPNLSSVTDMSFMFSGASSFNGDLSAWDVSNVVDMEATFQAATSFDKNIGSWDISQVAVMSNMFENAGLSENNYDELLIGWSTLDSGETQIPANISFNAGSSTYCAGKAGRTALTTTHNWTITDEGSVCDTDEDGIFDEDDNCPLIVNADQADNDVDGQGDVCDEDDDNDGTPDATDTFPLDATEDTDTDGDGTGNNTDTDDDGDGTPDNTDAFPLDDTEDADTDGDGTGNNTDTDDDGDGTPDNTDAFPLDDTEDTDTDGDGKGNNADTDDDGDGTPDNTDAFPLDDTEDTDTDGDGSGDHSDTTDDRPDSDNDGVPDEEDAFPNNSDESADTDNDGIGDNADADLDGDGSLDNGTDSDNDGINDDSDTTDDRPDSDNDGVPDEEDAFPDNSDESVDVDGDGVGANADIDDSNDRVGEERLIVSAQAFTPNGDNINDTWVIEGIENHPNALVTVYNRYGHEVFKAIGYRNDWNGKFRSNPSTVPAGSYYYVIDFRNGNAPMDGWIFINY